MEMCLNLMVYVKVQCQVQPKPTSILTFLRKLWTATGVADDAICAANSLVKAIALQELVFEVSSELAFIKQNSEKANFVIISNNYEEDKRRYERLNEKRQNQISEVESFEYLGTLIMREGMDLQNVFRRIDIAREQLDSLLYNGFIGRRILPLEVRMMLIGMYVNTSCLTTLETFYIDKKRESALRLFGNDCIRTVIGLSKSGPPLPLMLLTGTVNLNILLRANIVGLVLRMIASKDSRVQYWIQGQENHSIKIDNNLVDLFKKILRAHGITHYGVLFEENNINKENVKKVTKEFRKIICTSEFNRVKKQYIESEKCPYLNVKDMNYGEIYPTFVGGKRNDDLHGARIAAWLAGGGYFTYSKMNKMADCCCCGQQHLEQLGELSGDCWTHYLSGTCKEVERHFGHYWVNILEIIIRDEYHPIQDLDSKKNPNMKLMFLIDPNNRNLNQFRLPCQDKRLPDVVTEARRYLWAIHKYRSKNDAGLKIKGVLQEIKKKKGKKIKKKLCFINTKEGQKS